MTKHYLPEWFRDLPASFVFDENGRVRQRVADCQRQGVVMRIVAGPERVSLLIDIKRPYVSPPLPIPVPFLEATP